MYAYCFYITESYHLPCRAEVASFRRLLRNTFSLKLIFLWKLKNQFWWTNFRLRSAYCFDLKSDDCKFLILQTLSQAWTTAREHLTRTLLKWFWHALEFLSYSYQSFLLFRQLSYSTLIFCISLFLLLLWKHWRGFIYPK